VTVYRTTRITYDRQTDTLSFLLKEGVAVAESDEGNPGVSSASLRTDTAR
jgi:hypothetical protein